MLRMRSRRYEIWQQCCVAEYTVKQVADCMTISYSSAAQIVRSLCDAGHMIEIEKKQKGVSVYKSVTDKPPQAYTWHKVGVMDLAALHNPDNYLVCMRILFPQATKESTNATKFHA